MTIGGRWASFLLLAAGTLAGGISAEALLRIKARLEDRGLLTPDLRLPPDPLPYHPASLASIIRRANDPLTLYELRPNLKVLYETALVTTNEDGVRNPAPPRGPGAGFRIAGIGDSFMFGFGVADDQTYLARLTTRLAREDCPVDTVNLAVPGYNGVMEERMLERRGLAYRPDVVVMEFISNDLDLPNFVWRARDVWTPRRSFLRDFLRDRISVARRAGSAVAAPALEDAPVEPGTAGARFARVAPEQAALVGWASYERALRRLAQVAHQRGFAVVWMGWDIAPEEPRIRALAQDLGFHVLNLGPLVARWLVRHHAAAYAGSPLSRRANDAHPSALGHEQVSVWLERFLRDEKLLPTECR